MRSILELMEGQTEREIGGWTVGQTAQVVVIVFGRFGASGQRHWGSGTVQVVVAATPRVLKHGRAGGG